jgi:hypothetical protein
LSRTLRAWARWLRRKLGRTHWIARILRINRQPSTESGRGLIMLQIDGLARRQFERALTEGRLRCIRSLIEERRFSLESFYSGIPSTTPAVQAEIFFGIKCAVPSFEFMCRANRKIYRMYHAETVAGIEADLAARGTPLLTGGHSYANIFRGGAAKSWFCGQDLDLRALRRRTRVLRIALLTIAYLPSAVRLVSLTLLEVVIALLDMFRGLLARHDFWRELRFIPARIGVCLMAREMIRFRVMLDIEAGTRVIHANFLGYDEQAHRRGPDSRFAHWTLKGIDRAVRDIHRATKRAPLRRYSLLIYSDHGQERVVSFDQRTGRLFGQVMEQTLRRRSLSHCHVAIPHGTNAMLTPVTPSSHRSNIAEEATLEAQQIVVTAMGPLGHIYLPIQLDEGELEVRAGELVRAGVPLVLIRPTSSDAPVVACNRRGRWRLPEDAAELLGASHPFLTEAGDDLVRLCHHPDCGDLILCGWNRGDTPVSFAAENGAHGGPGPEETHGFLVLPPELAGFRPPTNDPAILRGAGLHRMATNFLNATRFS